MKLKSDYLIVLIFTFFSTTSFSQLHIEDFERIKKEKHVEEVIWADELTYKDFDLAKAKTYTDDDAVVLDQRTYHSQKIAKVGFCVRRQLFRYAVLIRTEKGVEDFSTFDLGRERGFDKYANVGIRVFKPDGRVVEIPEVEFEMTDEWKLAVPDLQVDDILEFYLFAAVFDGWDYIVSSNNITHYLASKYPTLHQYLEITLEKEAHLKYRLINGAPEPRIISPMPDYNGSQMIFDIDEVRPKIDDEWAYTRILSEPCIRYRFFFGKLSSHDLKAFHYNKDGPFSQATNFDIDKETIQRLSNSNVSTIYHSKYTKKLRKRILKETKELTYETTRAKVIDFFRRALHKQNSDDPLDFNRYSSMSVLLATGKAAKEFGATVQWIYVRPASYGEMKDMLHPSELREALRVKFEDEEDLLFYGAWMFAPLGTNFGSYDGAAAFVRTDNDERSWYPILEQLPIGLSADNRKELILDLRFHEDGLQGSATYKALGYRHYGLEFDCGEYERDLCYRLRSLLPYEENIALLGYPGESRGDIEVMRHPHRDESVDRMVEVGDGDGLTAQFGQWLLTNGKLMLDGFIDAEVEELDSMHLLSSGRLHPDDPFSFSSDFHIKDQVQLLGEDKLLKLSWLIDTFSESDRNREGNVDLAFAYSDHLTMSIAVPEGYTVEGLEELGRSVVNEFGSFTSTAERNGDEVEITYVLNVDKKHVDIADWDQVLAVFDAAYDFSEGKVLFKAP